jgi:hypothetical protein
MKLEFSRQIFEKRSNIKVHQNQSPGGRGGGMQDRQKDMTKLTVTSRNFANEPEVSEK